MIRKGTHFMASVVLVAALCSSGLLAQERPKAVGSDKPNQTSQSADQNSKSAAASDAATQDVSTPVPPSPEDIIKAFQRDRPTDRPIRPKNATRLRHKPAGSGFLLREGDFLNNLSGHLSQDGNWWTLVFLSDSTAAPRPPMRLLPNQQLERLIRETKASDHSVTFVVSGEVTLFESQNYLLLRKAMRRRDMGNLKK